MSENASDLSTEALEAVASLARSANRVLILDTLARDSVTRGELADRTPASRTTVDRIVNEFQERGWAERGTDGTYEATTQGAQLMRRFRPFVESVTALQRLDDAVDWLPPDELTIGLEHFSDAVVWEPATDPAETVEFMCDLVREATRFRVMADLVPPVRLEMVITDRVRAGGLTVDGVTTEPVVTHVGRRPDRADRWRAMIEAGATIAAHEGPLPCNLWVFDGTVLIKKASSGPVDESYGVPIVSEDATVLRWANELVDDWMATGTPVELDAGRETDAPE
jgi:predicted transcriptional regulator